MAAEAPKPKPLMGSVLAGNLDACPASPVQLLTIFVVGADAGFQQERQMLLDVVLPALQSCYSERGLHVQLVEALEAQELDRHPNLWQEQLSRMTECCRLSTACYFLFLLGDKLGEGILPSVIPASEFEDILAGCTDLETSGALDELYKIDTNADPTAYVLESPCLETDTDTNSNCADSDHNRDKIMTWSRKTRRIKKMLCEACRVAGTKGCNITTDCNTSATELLLKEALNFSTADHVVAVIKHIQGVEEKRKTQTQELEDAGNLFRFSLLGQTNGLDTNNSDHQSYLDTFSQTICERFKTLVDNTLNLGPTVEEVGRTLYETYMESCTHLTHCRKILSQGSNFDFPTLTKIEELVRFSHEGRAPNSPIVVIGSDCCGKTALLSTVKTHISGWLATQDAAPAMVCLVRYIGLTPRCMYLAEFLRCLCYHISLAFGFEVLPRHRSYEGSRLCTWFEELLRAVELTDNHLVLLLDDIHILKVPPPSHQSDVTASGALAWLPWSLPGNVHVICTMTSSTSLSCASNSASATSNVDRVLGSWKNKLLTDKRVVQFQPLECSSLEGLLRSKLKQRCRRLLPRQMQVLNQLCFKNASNLLICQLLLDEACHWTSSESGAGADDDVTLAHLVNQRLKRMETMFGHKLVTQLARYFTCTRYGITEAELCDLLHNNYQAKATVPLSGLVGPGPDLSFTLYRIRETLGPLVMERFMDNKILLSWRHRCLLEINKQRYFASQKAKRATHGEIANLFLLGFVADKNDPGSDVTLVGSSRLDSHSSETTYTFTNSPQPWTNVRPIEELWFHLLHTGDVNRIKQATVCNLEFLQVAVQGGAICYVLGILELVRTQILDMEIELVYHTLRLATDVLSKEPLQLASEIILWMRPFADSSLENVEALVTQAMEWCDSCLDPLLAPLTSWLWTPLPQQASVLHLPLGVDTITITHDSQYVICTTPQRTIQMYHVASRQLVRTFTGHHDRVVCVHVEKSGQYLVSGSEDTTVIVWDLVAATPYRSISEHFASVTCVATTQMDTLVISGSDDSRVIIVQLATGDVIHKIEHHRGAISSVAVTENDDVLVTGSADSTVCVWSLDNYSLLNTICLTHPVVQMDLSSDNAFLLVAGEDSKLHLRSLTTGSEIHSITGHESQVAQVQIASDSCRAVLGCHDHAAYVYDIHTTKLLYTLNSHNAPVKGIRVSQDDSFLFTAGGEKVMVWYFDRSRPQHGTGAGGASGCARQPVVTSHTNHVTCIAISKDGSLAISGSKDCLVKVWQLNQNEIHSTLEGHTAPVTCVAFAPNGLYAASGSEDKTVRVWGLTLGLLVSDFKEHQGKITAIKVLWDSRRILSADQTGMLKLWQADSEVVLLSCLGPSAYIDVTTNMRFAICGMGDNSLRIWTVSHEDQKYTVSHSDAILCYALTYDSKYVITGSRDTSLKIWDITAGRLTQVLVGHTGAVSCVSVAAYNHTLVFSGSQDCRLLIWDRLTGNELHKLVGHLGPVTCVGVTVDGKTVLSGSRDMTIRVWSSDTGHVLSMLDMHVPVVDIAISLDAAHVVAVLENCNHLPLLCLHNHPFVNVEEAVPLSAEDRIECSWSDVVLPRKAPHRLLHKEMSLDTYTWQKKYGGVTGKRSSTISLEDFRAVAITATAAWHVSSEKVNRSGTSSPSSSVSDVRSTHSNEFVPPSPSIASREELTVRDVSFATSMDSSNDKDLDVAPWDAEGVAIGLSNTKDIVTQFGDCNNIRNSEVCCLM